MTKTFCDRCSRQIGGDSPRYSNGQENVFKVGPALGQLMQIDGSAAYTGRIVACERCYNDLRNALEKWWRKEA